MSHCIHILNLEDNPNDAELNQQALAADGVACEIALVDTREAFLAAIERRDVDIILADYSLPGFDGLSALDLSRERCPEVPFIFVTGSMGEEVAIEALKKGATDYVLKDKLSRLAPAVRRALKERELKLERESVEKAQREQGEFLRNVFESIAQPFYVVDAQDYRIIMANSATGLATDEGSTYCFQIAHGVDHPCSSKDHVCPLERVKTTKRPVILEHTHRNAAGLPRIVEVHGFPVLDDRGEVIQMIEYCVDITDRRRLEEAMRSLLEGTSSVVGIDFFRKLVFHLAHALGTRYAEVALINEGEDRARTLAIWAKNGYAEDIGYDLAGTPCENVVHTGFCRYPEHVQQLFPQDRLLVDMGVESYMGTPLRTSSGEVVGLLAVMDDKPMSDAPFAEELLSLFSARAATELERQLNEKELARLATAVEQATEDIILADRTGKITYVNPAFERTLGYTRSEIEGQDVRILWSDAHDAAFYRKLGETISSGKTWTGHIRNCRKNGELIDEDATISSIRGADGSLIGYLGIMRDMTERMKLEAQLRQAQKMEAIGTLAGGIAHDFNNILAAIFGNLELALEDVPPDAANLREALTQVMRASERAIDLVRQILTFSRKSRLERKPIRLNSLVKEVGKLLRASIPSTIGIDLRVPAQPLVVFADLVQLHQVLMNLCTNAYHAMQEHGGTLMIELSENGGDGDTPLSPLPDPCVRLRVRDTGAGIPPEVIDRIFDPFFTTKTHGEGTGLGLSVVHGIVEGHGGIISVASELGKGATFDVFLPLWRMEDPQDERADALPPVRGLGERILLVDDEESIVVALQQRLTQLGYHVISTTSSLRAQAAFRENPGSFDVVIADQTMPGLTGIELAAEIRRLRPNCPVILCTGYSERVTNADVETLGRCELLMKPVKTRTLAEAVRRAIDAGPTKEPLEN